MLIAINQCIVKSEKDSLYQFNLRKGVGITTAAGFVAEVGDISRFTHPSQIQKLAGLNLVESSSGKHKGQTTISKRGDLGFEV